MKVNQKSLASIMMFKTIQKRVDWRRYAAVMKHFRERIGMVGSFILEKIILSRYWWISVNFFMGIAHFFILSVTLPCRILC